MSSVSTLAIGDRLQLIRKLIGFVGNIDPEIIKKLLTLFGGDAAAFGKIFDVVKLVLEFFKQPTTSSVGDADAHEKIESLCCSGNVTLAELDSVLSALAA